MDYPTRSCIVCSKPFTPHRKDQIFCSFKEDYTCSNNLRRAERLFLPQYLQAMIKQQYRCYWCEGWDSAARGTEAYEKWRTEESSGLVTVSFVRLGPVITDPSKADNPSPDPDDYEIYPGDIVAACLPCRRKIYLALANSVSTVEELAG